MKHKLRKFRVGIVCAIAAIAVWGGYAGNKSYQRHQVKLEIQRQMEAVWREQQAAAEKVRLAKEAAAEMERQAAARKAPVPCAQAYAPTSPQATNAAASDMLAGVVMCGLVPDVKEAREITRRMVTITDLQDFSDEFSLSRFLAGKVGDGEKAVEQLMQACVLADRMRRQSRQFFTAVSLDQIRGALEGDKNTVPDEWDSILTTPKRTSLVAIAPRFSDPPDFNPRQPKLKFIYEVGLETKDETKYDGGFAVMVNPALSVAEQDREEFLADVLRLRDTKGDARDFVAKWLSRASLGPIKVSCAAQRNVASDWVWFEAVIAGNGEEMKTELIPLSASLGLEGDETVNIGVLSYAARDDAVVPFNCKPGTPMCGSRYYWPSDDSVIGLRRSLAGVGTCSQCHRTSIAFHSRKQESLPSGNLESFGIPTFFTHLSANFRHPELGPVKSRFQTSWENYHAEVLREISAQH